MKSYQLEVGAFFWVIVTAGLGCRVMGLGNSNLEGRHFKFIVVNDPMGGLQATGRTGTSFHVETLRCSAPVQGQCAWHDRW